MNWEAVGALSDLIAGIGVIVALIYLAAQIRQNTTMMRGTAKTEQAALGQNLLLYLAEHPEMTAKIISGEEATAEEEIQISYSSRAFFRTSLKKIRLQNRCSIGRQASTKFTM